MKFSCFLWQFDFCQLSKRDKPVRADRRIRTSKYHFEGAHWLIRATHRICQFRSCICSFTPHYINEALLPRLMYHCGMCTHSVSSKSLFHDSIMLWGIWGCILQEYISSRIGTAPRLQRGCVLARVVTTYRGDYMFQCT